MFANLPSMGDAPHPAPDLPPPRAPPELPTSTSSPDLAFPGSICPRPQPPGHAPPVPDPGPVRSPLLGSPGTKSQDSGSGSSSSSRARPIPGPRVWKFLSTRGRRSQRSNTVRRPAAGARNGAGRRGTGRGGPRAQRKGGRGAGMEAPRGEERPRRGGERDQFPWGTGQRCGAAGLEDTAPRVAQEGGAGCAWRNERQGKAQSRRAKRQLLTSRYVASCRLA